MLQAVGKVGDPLAFYTVAATIIPVLFLALVYQTSTFSTESATWWGGRVFVALLAVTAGVIGEVSALHVLSTQQPTTAAKHTSSIGLLLL